MGKYNRIKLIKDIAAKLIAYDLKSINIVFKAFNIPTLNTIDGLIYEYAIEQMNKSEFAVFIELAEFLYIEENNYLLGSNNYNWKDGYFKIYISHLNSNKLIAISLKKSLEKYAINAFLPKLNNHSIVKDQNRNEIALKTCDSLIALVSNGFHSSYSANQEIGVGIGRDISILSVQMTNYKPYGMITKYPTIKFDNIEDITKNIFLALIQNNKTRENMASSLMFMFENSSTFSSAKENIILLEQNTFWNFDLIERLKNSPKENDQIRQAMGVKDRIDRIIREQKKFL